MSWEAGVKFRHAAVQLCSATNGEQRTSRDVGCGRLANAVDAVQADVRAVSARQAPVAAVGAASSWAVCSRLVGASEAKRRRSRRQSADCGAPDVRDRGRRRKRRRGRHGSDAPALASVKFRHAAVQLRRACDREESAGCIRLCAATHVVVAVQTWRGGGHRLAQQGSVKEYWRCARRRVPCLARPRCAHRYTSRLRRRDSRSWRGEVSSRRNRCMSVSPRTGCRACTAPAG